MRRKLLPYLLGFILGGLHLALFILVSAVVANSQDGEAGMLFYVFWIIDAPIAKFDGGLAWIILFGTLWWFCCGFALQSLIFCWKKGGALRLALSLTALILLCFSPNLLLVGKPGWEQEYTRGTQAANSGNEIAAVAHLKEAIRLAGPDNAFIISLYSYLGQLYLGIHDYDQAVATAKMQVELALKANATPTDPSLLSRSDAGPHRVMDAYNDLSTAYRLAERPADEKLALQEAAKWDRIVYQGDSIQEANCWSEIAEIVHDQGDRTKAIELMTKAQIMTAKCEPNDTFSRDYINDLLTKWKAEP